MPDDDGQLFGIDGEPTHHARRDDPDTSFDAVAAINIPKQARLVLRSYRDGSALLDFEAYDRAGILQANNCGQRCSDLRHAGLIERTGNKRLSLSGKAAYECRITDAGRAFLAGTPAPPVRPPDNRATADPRRFTH